MHNPQYSLMIAAENNLWQYVAIFIISFSGKKLTKLSSLKYIIKIGEMLAWEA